MQDRETIGSLLEAVRPRADSRTPQAAQALTSVLLRALDQLRCGVAVLSRQEHQLLYANAAFCELTGRTDGELAALATVVQLAEPSDQSSLTEWLGERHKETGCLEIALRRPSGERVWVELAVEAVGGGRDERRLLLARDVTAHREAVERESAARERFAKVFDVSPMAVALTRVADGRFLEVNGSWEALCGYARDEVIGRRSTELDLFADRADRDRGARILGKEGRLRDFEVVIRRPDGTCRDVLISAETTVIGGELCSLSVSLDITLRREAERALEREKERLAVTLRSIGDGVIATDTDRHVLLMNPVAESLTGWTAGEASGRPLSEVFRALDRRTRAPVPDPVEAVLLTRRTETLAPQTVLIARDGTEHSIADSASPILDEHGTLHGVVLVFRDLTEHERVEAELHRAATLESLGLVAGGVAHDFNNILTGILTNIQLAELDRDMPNSAAQRLVQAEHAVLRARDLTRQLLTFTREGAPVRRPTSLDELVRESTSFALSGSNVRATLRMPPGLLPVDADPTQMSQVVHNLVLNALQAMPEGGSVVIEGRNLRIGQGDESKLAPGDYVKLTVRDSGIGIPEAELPRIFDPFYTTKREGTGLGLASVYSIVQKHRGSIDVSSELGRGTTFTVILPAAIHAAEGPDAEVNAEPGRGSVLIIDDDKTVRTSLQAALRALGYDCDAVADGVAGVSAYEEALRLGRPFDAVMVDLTCPGEIRGEETLRRLKAIDAGVCAIVSSGYPDAPIVRDYGRYGFRGVLVKPYTIQEVAATLHRAMASRRS